VYSKENVAFGEAMGDANHDSEEHLSRADIAKLLLGDMVLILLWTSVAVVIYTVTERVAFLGLERTIIEGTAIVVGVVPTVLLLLFAADDVDEVYMAVRTRRALRRRRYRRTIGHPDEEPQTARLARPKGNEETNKPA